MAGTVGGRVPLSAVYGGGGMFGIGYGLGVAHGLALAGVPVVEAPSLGTSAGSWVASCLAVGIGYDELAALPPGRMPDPRPGALQGTARRLFGSARDARVRAVVARLPKAGRWAASGTDHDLADLVAASSAVPGLFSPHLMGRSLCVDGGVRSMCSADLAATAARLLVVAPLAGPVAGVPGRAMETLVRREMRAWRHRTAGSAVLIRPGRETRGLIRHPLDLFDRDRALRAYEAGLAQAAREIRDRERVAALVVVPAAA